MKYLIIVALLICLEDNAIGASNFSLHSVRIINSYPIDIDERYRLGNNEPEYLSGVRYQEVVSGRSYDTKDIYPACVKKDSRLKMEVILKGSSSFTLQRSCNGQTLEVFIFLIKNGSAKTFESASATLVQRGNGMWGCTIETNKKFQIIEKTTLQLHFGILEEGSQTFAKIAQRIYVIDDAPKEPMARPWATLLELAMSGNMGFNRGDYLSSITQTVHNSSWQEDNSLLFIAKSGKLLYTTISLCTKFIAGNIPNQQFSLIALLHSVADEDLVQIDCRDFSNLICMMGRSIGLDYIAPYNVSINKGVLKSKIYYSAGSLLSPLPSDFKYHQVLVDLSNPSYTVYDASLRIHDQSGPAMGMFSKTQYFYENVLLSCTPNQAEIEEHVVSSIILTNQAPISSNILLSEALPNVVNIKPEISLYINGQGFSIDASYLSFITGVDCKPYSGITVNQVTVLTPTQLKIDIDVESNVTPGEYNIYVTENDRNQKELPMLKFVLSSSANRMSINKIMKDPSTLEIVTTAEQLINLQITDLLGRNMADKTYMLHPGVNNIELNLPSTRQKSSPYLINIKGGDGVAIDKTLIY